MMNVDDVDCDYGIDMLDVDRKIYLDLSLELLDEMYTLNKYREAEQRVNAGKYQYGDYQCIQYISHHQKKVADLQFELDHLPPRPECLILKDITSRQQEINQLERTEYKAPGCYIPYDDWMGSCDGDKDYEAFWCRVNDQMRIDVIKTRELPSLEKELERTKRMTE